MRDVEEVRQSLGSIREVLERHGINARRPTCPNPQHDDRKPGSVRFYRAKRGEERLKCFSCQFNGDVITVAEALGEHIDWGTPTANRKWQWQPIQKRQERVKKTRLMNELQDDPTIERDWILAKKLAELGNLKAVQVEVLRNWDYLSENYNLPRAYKLCQGIWAYGDEKFGLPAGLDFKYLVQRLETSA